MKKNDELKEIKELIEIIKHKVDMMALSRNGQLATIQLIKDQQSVMNEKLNVICKDLETLSGDMEQVLFEVKSIHDEIGLWYQRDKREIDEIKKHLNLPIILDRPQ